MFWNLKKICYLKFYIIYTTKDKKNKKKRTTQKFIGHHKAQATLGRDDHCFPR